MHKPTTTLAGDTTIKRNCVYHRISIFGYPDDVSQPVNNIVSCPRRVPLCRTQQYLDGFPGCPPTGILLCDFCQKFTEQLTEHGVCNGEFADEILRLSIVHGQP
jgi:hypothetical protein